MTISAFGVLSDLIGFLNIERALFARHDVQNR
jgi:hypothetical protein